jgi:hypothetical protein
MSTFDDSLRTRPRSTLGGARTPRPLGADGPPGIDARSGLTGPPRGTRVADASRQTDRSKKRQAKPGPKASGREITIVGTFKNPFQSRAEEIKAMKENRWEPSTDDFVDVGGKTVRAESYTSILTAILVDGAAETKPDSIARINIFTHANADLIAFLGTITPAGAMTNVSLNVNSSLSKDVLDNLNAAGVTFTVNAQTPALKSRKFSIDDVRRRFTKDAVIVIYACKSGLDGSFVQKIADTFQVKVRGFSDLVGYFPIYDEATSAINRRQVGIGRNSQTKVTDFHKLDDHAQAVEKSPRAPTAGTGTPAEDDE